MRNYPFFILSGIVLLSCTDTRTEYLTYELGTENGAVVFQSGANTKTII
jgi:hypothetical protein